MVTDNRPVSGRSVSRLRRMLASCLRALRPDTASGRLPGTPTPLPEDDPVPGRLGRRFSNELFARLLLELPAHRRTLSAAYEVRDYRGLRENIHQLLGATAYCDAPELDAGLRELRLALKCGDTARIEQSFARAIGSIDATLRSSGHSGA